MKIIRLLALPALTAMLVACGGGGGDQVTTATTTGTTTPTTTTTTTGADATATPGLPASYIDKYVGVWTTACLSNDGVNESGKFISTISKKSDSVLTYALTATRFSGKTCTGTMLPSIFPGVTNDLTYVATVSDVDRFTYAGNGKSTLKITGSVLYVGNDLKLDTAGYPIIDFKDLAVTFNKN